MHHICRGNNRSSWTGGVGGYEAVAEKLFNTMNVDRFLLEYDTDRAGGFEPLRFVPKDKMVVLGIVSSKIGAPESKDSLIRRIEEASQVHLGRPAGDQPPVRLRLGGDRRDDRRRAGGEAAVGRGRRAADLGLAATL